MPPSALRRGVPPPPRPLGRVRMSITDGLRVKVSDGVRVGLGAFHTDIGFTDGVMGGVTGGVTVQ